MFEFFKKKPDSSLMFDDSNWQVGQGEYDGNPILIRINANLKPFTGKTDHNLKISFAIPLKQPNPGAMPHPEENKELGAIEDKILEILKSKGSVVQALAITMGTFKELVFYAVANLDVKAAHEEIMERIKSHEVQCIANIEKNGKRIISGQMANKARHC